jgi:hypothetical protein
MKIAVTDANIFIDLIKLRWLGYLFSIGLEIYSSREVIDELNDNQLEQLNGFIQSQQIKVYSFSAEELISIHAITAPASLTVEDKSILFLARKLEATVLTGDNPLRKFCLKNELDVKGIIWLFDRFLELEVVGYEVAINQMNNLLSFNDRLPVADCEQRLKMWKEHTDSR